MLRLQQDKVLPGILDPFCAYQPPWTDKKFYLMDGLGRRQILVDESNNPRKFLETNLEKTGYLRPTAGKLSGRFICKLESHRVKNSERPINFKAEYSEVYEEDRRRFTHAEWKREPNHRLANPTLINREWEVVVRELDWNLFENLYPLWKAKELERQAKEGLKIGGKDVGTPNCATLVALLPQEVWESIIAPLDGIGFLRLVDALADLKISHVLWDALGANITAGKFCHNFWRNTCLQRMSNFSEIITSYSNCIVDGTGRRGVVTPFYDASLDHDAQDAVEASHSFIYKLTQGDLIIKEMTALENKIKTNIQLHHQILRPGKEIDPITGEEVDVDGSEELEKDELDNQPRRYAPHKFVVDTIGSICYYVINPFKSTNLMIMEDFETCVERRVTIACNSKHLKLGINYTKIMYYPRYKEVPVPEGGNDNTLPEIDRLIFSVCRKCTTARSVDGRTGFTYTHEIDEEQVGTCHKMEPILAFHEDVFVLWHSPMPVEFHKVIRNARHYSQETFQKLHVTDATKYWNLLGNYTQYFIPVLKKVLNRGPCAKDEEFIRQYFGDAEAAKDYYYELQFVNMRLGTDSISLRNTCEIVTKTNAQGAVTSLPIFRINHRNPQYYYNNALEYRSLLDVCYSGCTGHDLYIFWNHRALACSWGDGYKWIFHSWKKALAPLVKEIPSFADSENLFISQMTVCSREVLAATINGNVVIFKAILHSPGRVYENPDNKDECCADEPSFIMEPIRLVALDLISKNMAVEQLTFSFDKGEPYFMLLYRDNGPTASALDFWITRLCFSFPSPDAILESIPELMREEESQIVADMADPVTLLKNHSFSEAIAITVIGCKLLNLKRRVGLGGNGNKTYSQLVDEIILRKRNQGLFNLAEHPKIVYQAVEWAEELRPRPGPVSSSSRKD